MNMRWGRTVFGALMVGAVAAHASEGDPEQKRRLVEQKVRLIESLVDASRAEGGAGPGQAPERIALIEQGRHSLAAARAALAEERLDDAAAVLDEALKSVASASRTLSPTAGKSSEAAQRAHLQELSDQVAMYREALAGTRSTAEKPSEITPLLERLDALAAESKRLANGGKFGDAVKKMADAYVMATAELSRLRAGQEVVLALNFDSPADEYAYEKKRFDSNQLMVRMMVEEGRGVDRVGVVEDFTEEGRRLNAEAEVHARSGRYEDAIKLMEQAGAQLVRALQAMGLPVF